MPAHNGSAFDKNTGEAGPIETEGYVCNEKGGDFKLQKVMLPSLGATMVEAELHMTGLCHTDVSMRDNAWGITDYPLLAGHEAVGTVTRVGSAVRTVSEGDRVAIAWVRDSCRACDACIAGRENICEEGYQGTYLGKSAGSDSPLEYNKHGGCFARLQRIEEKFAIKLPDGLPAEMACPLLCGGGTVYEPLCDYSGPGVKVAIVGVGGLGTAALKLGKLRGSIMYAISRSEKKREGALGVGADEFICTENADEVEKVKSKLDVVIDTRPVNGDVAPMLELLKSGGVYCRVGIMPADDQDFSAQFHPLVFKQLKIVGSAVTGTRRLKEMLELVVANMDFMKDTDAWKTEHVPMADVNKAMKNLVNGTNKSYRYILEWDK